MRSLCSKILAITLICAGGLILDARALSAAQQHVVSPAQLQKATVQSSATRRQNQTAIENFFSSKAATQALKSAHINPAQVKNAIPSLSNQEMASLAARVNKTNFAAGDWGHFTTEQVTILIIAAAIVIIVIAAT